MSKLPGLSSDEVLKALRKIGFVYALKRGKGSHVALYRTDTSGKTRLVIFRSDEICRKGRCARSSNRSA